MAKAKGIYKRTLKSGNVSWIADYINPFNGKRRRESFSQCKHAVARMEEIVYRKIKGEPLETGRALRTTLGESAGTQAFYSVDKADVVMLIGANPTEAHPVFGSRLKQRLRQGAKLIVVDPRKTELVDAPHVRAAHHCRDVSWRGFRFPRTVDRGPKCK